MGNFVLEGEGFKVIVYENDHPPPHCHLKRNEDDITVVKLPLLGIRHGKPLSKREKRFLLENLDEICEAFDNRTPKREQS